MSVNPTAIACPKRSWKCQHCDFKSTLDAGIQHEDKCTKYPVPCPNECLMFYLVSPASPFSAGFEPRVRMIPRCDIEQHRAECPLEIVDCEFADVGCKVRTTRQELKRHMEESQQEHLLSATLLNLRLTRETITEKDRQIAEMQKQLAEKDRQIKAKDHHIAEKDRQIAAKDRQIAEKDRQIAKKDQQLSNTSESIATKNCQMLTALIQSQQGAFEFTGGILQYSHYSFTVQNFSECQKHGAHGDWLSDPFFLQPGENKLLLNLETKQSGDRMPIRLYCGNENPRGKTFVLVLQMLNQLNNHSHFLRQWEATNVIGRNYSRSYDYIKFEELYKREGSVQYLKDDCIKFVLWIKIK